MCALVVGEPIETYTFRFAPPETVHCTQTIATTTVHAIGDVPPIVTRSVSTTDIRMTRRANGYVMVARPVSSTATRNGEPFRDPTMVLDGLVFTTYITADGQIDSLTGYDALAQRLGVREEVLVQREITEWNGRIGEFVGATLAPGDSVRSAMAYPLPRGDTLVYDTWTIVRPAEPCSTAECLRIDTRYDATSQDGTRIAGHATRLIDPNTMLIYMEDAERTITMRIGPMSGTLTEERRYTFIYR